MRYETVKTTILYFATGRLIFTGLEIKQWKTSFGKRQLFPALASKPKMGFDQQRLMYYVFRPRGLVHS